MRFIDRKWEKEDDIRAIQKVSSKQSFFVVIKKLKFPSVDMRSPLDYYSGI